MKEVQVNVRCVWNYDTDALTNGWPQLFRLLQIGAEFFVHLKNPLYLKPRYIFRMCMWDNQYTIRRPHTNVLNKLQDYHISTDFRRRNHLLQRDSNPQPYELGRLARASPNTNQRHAWRLSTPNKQDVNGSRPGGRFSLSGKIIHRVALNS